MTELPAGTVTFLFTDIEGSTRLLQELGDAYADALAEHRRVLRDAFARHGGVEVDTQGDAFFVAFSRAKDALAAAEDAQAALRGPIRVRMGLHTGEPLVTDEGYVGIDVHRAARIAAVGHGGQILVSQSTRDLVSGDGLRNLGEHRLKDLAAPERIYQLGEGDFPPLKSLNQTNLPVQPTVLIGRERELSEIAALLQREDVRLLTLTGTGGTGKTRLALQLAGEQIEWFAEGVYFVALAPIVDPDLVLPTVAQTLGVKETAGQSLEETLADYLREREILLVLDNFEQLVVEAAPAVGELLRGSPELKLLVTSRAPLRLSGEHEYAVPPLALPEPREIGELAVLSQYESVALFVERARAVKSDFVLTNENGPAIAEICVRLDGLPLAIELAAARARVLPPTTLLARLDQRLKLLTGGARDAPERQQTLRAAIDWSYSLLAEEERRLFAQLSVFVGGCTLETAEAVCDPERELSIDVLDGLTSLVEKSLLRETEDPSGEPRFSMLETIREYAAERLDEQPNAEEVRRRHGECFRRLSEEAAPQLAGGEQQGAWLARLEAEHDNLRAALTFWRREPDAQLAIAASLETFWYLHGHWQEGGRWLEEALVASDEASPQRLKALEGAYYLAYLHGDTERARTLLDEKLALARRLQHREGIAAALHGLANLAIGEGDLERAYLLEEESLRFCEGERYSLFALSGLGWVAFFRNDYAHARTAFEEAVAVGRAFNDQSEVANDLASLATVIAYEGQEQEALSLLRESVTLARKLGSQPTLVNRVLPGFATVRAVRKDAEGAVRIIGAATALREEMSSFVGPVANELKRRILEAAQHELDEEQTAAAFEAGRSLTLDDALSYALEEDIARAPARAGHAAE